MIRNLTQAGYRIQVVHDMDDNRLAEYQIDNTTGVSTLPQEYIWLNGEPVAVVVGARVCGYALQDPGPRTAPVGNLPKG